MRLIDITNRQFGRLMVLGRDTVPRKGVVMWRCRCSCGNVVSVASWDLRTDHTQSCGCLRIEKTLARTITHGLSNTYTYHSWKGAINRCHNKNEPGYKYYGARGIKVCDRWRYSMENFIADMGDRPEATTIERINNEGDYELGNCCWATPLTQAQNRRPQQTGISGITGVYRSKKKWKAVIWMRNKDHHLGTFDSIAAAARARQAAERRYKASLL